MYDYFIVQNYQALEVLYVTEYKTTLHIDQLLFTVLNFQETVCTEHV